MNKTFDQQSPRIQMIWLNVEKLYASTERPESKWLWENHVQFVAEQASKLSDTYKANKEFTVAGALLHDIADVWLDRKDPQFELKCEETAAQVLHDAGFQQEEVREIQKEVIALHSCYPEHLPTTLEGKILATADALAHLTTTFYDDMFDVALHKRMTKEEYPAWVREKIKRDFESKIFFPEVKEQVRNNYETLKKNFSEENA